MRPRTFIDGLVTPPRKPEPGIPCPHCGTIIPEKEIASYAARRASAAADPRNYKPGPGRTPTIPHKSRDPRCGCVDCRKARRAAAIARREAKDQERLQAAIKAKDLDRLQAALHQMLYAEGKKRRKKKA